MEHHCLGPECTVVLMIPCTGQQQLVARLAESEAENDQWQKKVAELWADIENLRAAKEHA